MQDHLANLPSGRPGPRMKFPGVPPVILTFGMVLTLCCWWFVKIFLDNKLLRKQVPPTPLIIITLIVRVKGGQENHYFPFLVTVSVLNASRCVNWIHNLTLAPYYKSRCQYPQHTTTRIPASHMTTIVPKVASTHRWVKQNVRPNLYFIHDHYYIVHLMWKCSKNLRLTATNQIQVP